MPANAGIQVCFRFNFQNRLDSGFRRNDGNKSRLPVDKLKTPRLGAEGCSVYLNVSTFSRIPETWKYPAIRRPLNVLNVAQRLNVLNVWNGPIPMMNRA